MRMQRATTATLASSLLLCMVQVAAWSQNAVCPEGDTCVTWASQPVAPGEVRTRESLLYTLAVRTHTVHWAAMIALKIV